MQERKRFNKTQLLDGTGINPREARLIANNTVEFFDKDNSRVIRHFHTNILRFEEDGTIVFNTDGHRSVTTKARLNNQQDMVSIWTESRVWYARSRLGDETKVFFQDGMTFHPTRGFENAGKLPDKKLIKNIRKYAQDFVDQLPSNPPDSGNCWFCSMFDRVTENPSTEHLLEHIKDRYFVPSLLMNALKEVGAGDYLVACAFNGCHQSPYYEQLLDSYRKYFARYINSYLYKRLVYNQTGEHFKSQRFTVL